MGIPFRNAYHKGIYSFMGQTRYYAPDEIAVCFDGRITTHRWIWHSMKRRIHDVQWTSEAHRTLEEIDANRFYYRYLWMEPRTLNFDNSILKIAKTCNRETQSVIWNSVDVRCDECFRSLLWKVEMLSFIIKQIIQTQGRVPKLMA